MAASEIEVDFRKVRNMRQRPSGVLRHAGAPEGDKRPMDAEGKLLTPKQVRARARRRFARGESNRQGSITKQEFEALYKPIEEWDLEELAKGRPRNSQGTFSGRAPEWITREVHEQAMGRFVDLVKSDMNEAGISAITTLKWVLENEEKDDKGKYLVPASTKTQAAMFFLEHIVGKPKQEVKQDISVKLQGILGAVMVNPNEALAPPSQGGTFGDLELNAPGYQVAHLPGHTIPMGVSDDVLDGEVEEGE